MEDVPQSFLDLLSLFPLISKLFSVKYQKISCLISFFYIFAITKLKPKILKVKSLSVKKFEDLILHTNYRIDVIGDSHSCALLSINTLIALSIRNKSWLKISKLNVKKAEKDEGEENNSWKITMPPVEKNPNCELSNYYIQCFCISNTLEDFVLYVTDVKLFNISNQWNETNVYCDLVKEVNVESKEANFFPKIAKSAVVAGITSSYELIPRDYEDILDEYFFKPKCLKANEIFQVSLSNYGKDLKSRVTLCNVQDVYFKVISITGDSDKKEYYIVKGCTNLYLNPPVHGFLPQKTTKFIKPNNCVPGFEIPLVMDGLYKYYEKVKKMCKLFLRNGNVGSKGMFLLCGPKGSGKRRLVKSVAASFGLHFLQVNCFDFYGLNPSLIQGKFDQLFAKARRTVPCIIFLENIELLGREQNYHENARLIDIFQSQINELWMRKPNSYPLIIFGSTHSKPLDLIPAIARLFIHTVALEAPKFEETCQILKWLLKRSNMIYPSMDLCKVAERVRGYVCDDLDLLVTHAARFQCEHHSVKEECNNILLQEHFDQGMEIMEAAYSDSIGAARVPTVHWDDVGGLADLKEEIMLTLNLPLTHPELFTSGLKRSGILFYGPPGTGKTLMAKAVATECNYNFLSVKGPELMNMYVGQSEKNVREVFERAREASPCIIFFDELDSLAPSRGKSGDSGGVTDRVVSQLLAEMDGLNNNKDVFVIAATNRPDLVDPALLRPGRFDKMFYVGVCKDVNSKLSILKALTRRFSLSLDIDFEKLLENLPGQVTGADLYSICSNAWFSAARRAVNDIEEGLEISLPLEVSSKDFSEAVQEFVPSLTMADIEYYEQLKSSEGISK